MKTLTIIITIIIFAVVVFKHTKIYHEAKILTDLQKNINRTDILKGLTMNGIRHEAAILLMDNKISEDFYKKIFIVKKEDCGKTFYEANEEIIKNYK